MSSFQFSLFEDHAIHLAGDGPLRESLERDYQWFRTDDDVEPDVRCRFEWDLPSARTVLGDQGSHAGRVDDWFVLKDRGDSILLDPDWERMRCTPNDRNWRVPKLLEGRTRLKAGDRGLAMTHASAIEYEGKTIVLPAWRHTGKTNTMLQFLVDGASFLTDDRLWLDEEGRAHPYPVAINLLPYNFRAFPDLQPDTLERIRGDVAHWIDSVAAESSSKLTGAVNVLSNHLLKPDDRHFQVGDLFPGQACETPRDVDALVLLQTTRDDEPTIESIDADQAVRSMSRISYREWNGMMRDVAAQFDVLFPEEPSKLDAFDALEARERSIFGSVAESADVYRLFVPREASWGSETKRSVVGAIRDAIE